MKNMYDVRKLLRQFGIWIYIGNREAEFDLMEMELNELFQMACISKSVYHQSILVIRKEARNLRKRKGANAHE